MKEFYCNKFTAMMGDDCQHIFLRTKTSEWISVSLLKTIPYVEECVIVPYVLLRNL